MRRARGRAQDYLFRGIQKSEWANLFEFIQAKRLRVENLDEAAGGPGGGRAIDLGEDIDTGARRGRGCKPRAAKFGGTVLERTDSCEGYRLCV